MKPAQLWSRILVIAGFVLMLVGAIDPLEGSLLILPACAMVTFGTFLGRSRHRKLVLWGLVLVALGVGAIWLFTAFGGLGGDTGRSMWWALCLLPYPAGWIMCLVGAILRMVETFRRRAAAEQQAGS